MRGGNIWATNNTTYSISELTNSGAALSPPIGITGSGFYGGIDLAVDHQNNIWVVAEGMLSAQVSKVAPTGAILSGSGYVGGGIQTGSGGSSIAIDGDGNAWVSLFEKSGVVELSNSGVALSGSNGYQSGIALSPNSLVLDGSGDVWVASATFQPSGIRGIPGVYTWRITEVIGVAAPVVTPLAVGVQNNTLGARP